MVERCPALFALNLRPHGDFSGGMLSAQDSCPSSRLALLTLATHALPSPRLVGGQVATGGGPTERHVSLRGTSFTLVSQTLGALNVLSESRVSVLP